MASDLLGLFLFIGCMVIFFMTVVIYERFAPKLGDVRIVQLADGRYAVEKRDYCGCDEHATADWIRQKEFNALSEAETCRDSIAPKREVPAVRVVK